MREKILFGVTSYAKQCKNLRNIRASLATIATQVQKGHGTTKMVDSTIKGQYIGGRSKGKK